MIEQFEIARTSNVDTSALQKDIKEKIKMDKRAQANRFTFSNH